MKSWNNTFRKLGILRKNPSKSNRRKRRRRLRFEGLESRQMLAITVNTLVDEFDQSITDGDISIRDAIFFADSEETIDFASSLNGATITLDRVNRGHIEVSKSLTIDASSTSNGVRTIFRA